MARTGRLSYGTACMGPNLLINHGWRSVLSALPPYGKTPAILGKVAGAAITFLCVVIAWVFFRATTFSSAARILQAMAHPKSIHCASDCFVDIYHGILIPQISLGYLGAFFTCGFALV